MTNNFDIRKTKTFGGWQKVFTKSQASAASQLIPYIALIIIVVFFTLMAPDRFATQTNFLVILQQSSVVAIVAFGLAFVIMSGSIDLSVGSVMALSGIVAASSALSYGPVIGCITGIFCGALAGLFNGVCFSVFRVPSFVVTLGMYSIARGLTILYSSSRPIQIYNSFEKIGQRPGILIVLAVAFCISYILLNYTSFGRYTLAIGGEERVAYFSGVPIRQIKFLLFGFSGLMAGLGGVVLSARMGAATPTAATGFELSAIAAVVLGGTPLTGGIGNISSTIIGALIITSLINGMVILGVRPELQLVIQGLVLIFAVLISLDRSKIGVIK